MSVITLASGRCFPAERGVTLLDAALASGMVLEHSCRTGRCGTCKARVVRGEVAALREASALTAGDLRSGWVLTCTHEARSDTELDIEDLGALAGIAVKTLPSRIDALELLAPDVLRVVLRLPPTAAFRFLAGQSIDLTSPGGIRRSYSMSSDAAATSRLELQVRRVDQGRFSDYWFNQARVGDLLRFTGPRGTFYLRPVAGADIVFLATGTGIAPIKSMLLQLAALGATQPATQQPASVTLYWGGRHAPDLYENPRLTLPGLRFVPVLSKADTVWRGARGHVQEVLLADGLPSAETAVYACGSEAMIRDARSALLAAGLPARQFFSDAFLSSD